MAMSDDHGCFVPGPRLEIAGTSAGPLAGLDFAVKDLIDVAGSVTGCGNPDWARTHGPPSGMRRWWSGCSPRVRVLPAKR